MEQDSLCSADVTSDNDFSESQTKLSQSDQSAKNIDELTQLSSSPTVPPQTVEQEEGHKSEAPTSKATEKKTLSLFLKFFKLPENIREKFSSMPTLGLEELIDKFGFSESKLEATNCEHHARREDLLTVPTSQQHPQDLGAHLDDSDTKQCP